MFECSIDYDSVSVDEHIISAFGCHFMYFCLCSRLRSYTLMSTVASLQSKILHPRVVSLASHHGISIEPVDLSLRTNRIYRSRKNGIRNGQQCLLILQTASL